MIEPLPLLTPNSRRSEQTIARCHARLARRRKRLETMTRANMTYLAIERALIGGLCVVYISAVLAVAIQILSGS